jgi:hypothetical protein
MDISNCQIGSLRPALAVLSYYATIGLTFSVAEPDPVESELLGWDPSPDPKFPPADLGPDPALIMENYPMPVLVYKNPFLKI